MKTPPHFFAVVLSDDDIETIHQQVVAGEVANERGRQFSARVVYRFSEGAGRLGHGVDDRFNLPQDFGLGPSLVDGHELLVNLVVAQ
jgi:hypothetical protein